MKIYFRISEPKGLHEVLMRRSSVAATVILRQEDPYSPVYACIFLDRGQHLTPLAFVASVMQCQNASILSLHKPCTLLAFERSESASRQWLGFSQSIHLVNVARIVWILAYARMTFLTPNPYNLKPN